MLSFLHNRRWIVLGVLLLAGCAAEDQIQTYTVPKPQPEVFEPKVRLLGVIVEQPPNQWFFKLSGVKEEIDKYAKGFEDLVASVKFTGKADPATSRFIPPAEW